MFANFYSSKKNTYSLFYFKCVAFNVYYFLDEHYMEGSTIATKFFQFYFGYQLLQETDQMNEWGPVRNYFFNNNIKNYSIKNYDLFNHKIA